MNKKDDELIAASDAIKEILKELELKTGKLVDCVSINEIDVTTFADNGKNLIRSVMIEMKNQPGTGWA